MSIKKLLFNIFSNFFIEDIEELFIENEIKEFKLDKKNPLILEKLSDLYQYPEWKIFSKIISNRAKSLSFQIVKDSKYNEAKHAFVRGQIFNSAILLRLIKYSNKKHQGKNNARSKKV